MNHWFYIFFSFGLEGGWGEWGWYVYIRSMYMPSILQVPAVKDTNKLRIGNKDEFLQFCCKKHPDKTFLVSFVVIADKLCMKYNLLLNFRS